MALFNCELLDLRAFLAVHETRSFHRAAVELNMSQPAISRRIQKLEEMAGGPLFDRTTRMLADTALGKELIPVAQRALEFLDQSLFGSRNTRQPRSTLITIHCIPTGAFYFLPSVISRFMADYPHVRIRIHDAPAVEGLDLVARGVAEFGINILGLLEPGLEFDPLVDDPYVLACRRDHPLAARTVVDWDELRHYPLIAVQRTSRNRTLLDAELAKHGKTLEWRYEVAHLTTSLGLVAQDVGISILPKMATPSEDSGSDIVTRPLSSPQISRTIGIIRRANATLTPAADQLLRYLRQAWPGAGLDSDAVTA